jgi:hypothetical protein
MTELLTPPGLVTPKWPYAPHPKQYQALRYLGLLPDDPPPDGIPVNILLYAGESQGGKSHLARILASRVALMFPGSIGAIFRRVTDDIRKTQIIPFRSEVPPELGTYNDTEKTFFWKNGSQTRFHHCVEEDSHESYRSHLWDVVIFEESTEFLWPQITFLWSRVIPSDPRRWPIVLLTTNSIGISHMEHKTFFVAGRTGDDTWEVRITHPEFPELDEPRRIGWIPIATADNPSVNWAQTKAAQLSIADPELRKSMATGSWDLNVGSFFSGFRRDVHVLPEHREPPPDWRVWRGLDYGEAAPACCLWAATDPSKPYPNTYIFQELFEPGIPPQMQAKIILSLSESYPSCRTTWADPSIWKNGKKGISGPSFEDEYRAGGLLLQKASNKRHEGWSRIQKALFRGMTTAVPPELTISPNCTNLIAFLETAQRDPHDFMDIKEASNQDGWRDDSGDAMRYLLMGAAAARSARPRPQPWRFVPR